MHQYLAEDFDLKYIETSVKTKENILNALHLLIDNIYDQKDSNPNIKNRVMKKKNKC